jgi:hypothetical protein
MSIFQTTDMYKVGRKVATLEEMRDILAVEIDEKFKLEISKADSGAKKYFTGNTVDTLIIKKNGYLGLALTFDPHQQDRDYGIVSMIPVTPNALIEWLTRNGGILDRLIFQAIWGSPKKLHQNVEDAIIKQLNASKVDTSMKNTMKSMFTGKSIIE